MRPWLKTIKRLNVRLYQLKRNARAYGTPSISLSAAEAHECHIKLSPVK